MRVGFFILLLFLFLVSCSSTDTTGRSIASIDSDYHYGEISYQKSSVKLFPPEIDNGVYRYFFYLQLKNSLGEFVDCDPVEIDLKNTKGKKPFFTVERFLRGRYYVSVEANSKLAEGELDFLVSGRPLKEQFKLMLKQPVFKSSWIKTISIEKNKYRLKLFLGDSQKKPVQIPSYPEFIIEGFAHIENLEQVADGTWEFNLTFPERNEIIYISVRAHASYFERMFRLQYIEK